MARRAPSSRTRRSTTQSKQPRRVTKHLAHAGTLAATALVLATGCNTSDASTSQPSPTLAPPGSVTTAVPSTTTASRWNADEQAVVDAYQQFLVAVQDAAERNDGDVPVLTRTTSTGLLATIRQTLATRDQQGLRVRRAQPSKARAEVYWVSIEGTAGHLAACVVDDAVVYRLATGEVVDDKVTTFRKVARFEQVNGAWQVAAQQPKGDALPGEELDTCVAGA